MKKKLLFNVAFGAVALSIAATVLAQGETPLPSTVMRLKGHARCSTDKSRTWHRIKEGDMLFPGSLVQTAQGSQMDLLLGEEVKPKQRGLAAKDFYNPEAQPSANLVGLGEDTLLLIEKLTRKRTTNALESVEEIMLDLRTGMIIGNVGKLSGGSKYEVGFRDGVIGTHGGIYQLRHSGELAVLKGRVFIAESNGQPARGVTAGRQYDPTTGLINDLPPPPSSSNSKSSSFSEGGSKNEPPSGRFPPQPTLPAGRYRPPARP